MKLESLKNKQFYCTFSECHKQSWKNESEWTGYKNIARGSHAFILIYSDMEMKFHSVDGKTLIAKKGDVIYVPKNIRYTVSFFNTSNHLDSYTVNFLLSDESGNELIFDDEMRILENKWNNACIFAVEEFYKAYINRGGDRIKPQARFYDFLDVVCELLNYKTRYYYPIKKGVELLIAEWNENKKIEYYAKQCGMDKSYFFKLFKAWSGMSPNEYRNVLRISVAKSTLKNSNVSIYEIAEKIGFDDPYYFSRLFKKEVGISPLHYRHTHGDLSN